MDPEQREIRGVELSEEYQRGWNDAMKFAEGWARQEYADLAAQLGAAVEAHENRPMQRVKKHLREVEEVGVRKHLGKVVRGVRR